MLMNSGKFILECYNLKPLKIMKMALFIIFAALISLSTSALFPMTIGDSSNVDYVKYFAIDYDPISGSDIVMAGLGQDNDNIDYLLVTRLNPSTLS